MSPYILILNDMHSWVETSDVLTWLNMVQNDNGDVCDQLKLPNQLQFINHLADGNADCQFRNIAFK